MDFLTVRNNSGHVVVFPPRGPLTADQCSPLRRALRSAASSSDFVAVDLIDVTEFDDAIAQVLVGAAARCRSQQVQFLVRNADAAASAALARYVPGCASPAGLGPVRAQAAGAHG